MRQSSLVSDTMRAFAEVTGDATALLTTIAREVARAVGGFCAIGLPSADGAWLEPVAAFDEDPQSLAFIREIFTAAPIRLDSAHASSRVFATGEPFFTPQVDEAYLDSRFSTPEDVARARRLQVGSSLLLALRVHGTTLGILSLLRHGPGALPLDADDIRMAQSLADHAALALSNARLIARLQVELVERKRAEEARAASEARLRQIFETPSRASGSPTPSAAPRWSIAAWPRC